MKAVRLSFLHMLKFIRHDMMLFAACFAPPLAGTVFKLAIPFIEKILTKCTGAASVLFPYYGIFDLFFSMLAPTMFCFIAAMIMLEEHDDHIDSYLFVTALGRTGYILSRIFMPSVIAFIFTAALLPIFSLTSLSTAMIVFLSITGTLQGIIIALLIVTLSTNKLEGMAITKLSTITILGILIPYFVPYPLCYILSFLPSFWTGKAVYEHKLIYMLPSIFTAFIWIYILLRKFNKKISI